MPSRDSPGPGRVHLIQQQSGHADRLSWQVVLDSEVEAVLDVLTSREAQAIELRQNSPFAGVLSESERLAVLAAFVELWRQEHVA